MTVAASGRRAASSVKTSHGSKLSSCSGHFFLGGCGPGGVFVVEGVVAQAAVQDSHQPVPESAQGLMVGGSACSAGVVVGPGTGRSIQRCKSLTVQRVAETAVAGITGRHQAFLAGGAGDRTHAGVVLPRPGIGVTMRVVAELGQHPGTEHRAEAWLAQVDLSVRVPAKTLLHLPLQCLDLSIQLSDDRYQGLSGGGVGGLDPRSAGRW
jgi:hypothetical protein